MPQDMTAVINFRLGGRRHGRERHGPLPRGVQDKGVEMRFLQANDPSAIARRDGYGYRTVVESFQRYYPEAVFIPSMAVARRTRTAMRRSATRACGAARL